ncbi:AAA family ATPase [[Mycoplasma] cavipharyngis]|uniref:AAA family ATPase n=1 Tax=[Mycoplasma] cavipharyngis TaxID=92757 RepID=UPI003704859C
MINLIKYHTEDNDFGFRNEAYKIVESFYKSGDYQLAEYVMSLFSSANTFVRQINEQNLTFNKKTQVNGESLLILEMIKSNILGIINVVGHKVGVNKFLFQVAPVTGKTKSAKHIARLLRSDLFIVDFSLLIDSKLGQTAKNITQLFNEINNLITPEKVVILFDEIDSLTSK